MKDWLRSDSIRLWLAVVGAATLVLGAAYTMVQQSTRLAANDLPLQTAQNIRHQLANGATAQFTGSYSNSGTLSASAIRVDHTLNSRLTIFGRYNNAPSRFVRQMTGRTCRKRRP